MKDYIVRGIKPDEIPLLSDFLYESIFQRDESNLAPRDIIMVLLGTSVTVHCCRNLVETVKSK